jgi:hypothetical protein
MENYEQFRGGLSKFLENIENKHFIIKLDRIEILS